MTRMSSGTENEGVRDHHFRLPIHSKWAQDLIDSDSTSIELSESSPLSPLSKKHDFVMTCPQKADGQENKESGAQTSMKTDTVLPAPSSEALNSEVSPANKGMSYRDNRERYDVAHKGYLRAIRRFF